MRIGLISDTHGFLDESLFTYFAECDEIWHAGDVGSVELLDRLRAFKPIKGVSGNIDGADIRTELRSTLEWECEGVRVLMTHIGSPAPRKDLERYRPDLFICGHSHILKIARDPKYGFLYMNPGACGHKGWHTIRTAIRFTALDGKLSAVEAIELGPRGHKN